MREEYDIRALNPRRNPYVTPVYDRGFSVSDDFETGKKQVVQFDEGIRTYASFKKFHLESAVV